MFIISCDHNGVNLKNEICKWLKNSNIEFIDVGPKNFDKTDSYVVYAKKAVENFKDTDKICIICGTGVGVSIVANRHKGVRAVLGYDSRIVKKSVEHNNANCICLGANYISKRKAIKLLKVFLNAKFEGGRHISRIEDIDK